MSQGDILGLQFKVDYIGVLTCESDLRRCRRSPPGLYHTMSVFSTERDTEAR